MSHTELRVREADYYRAGARSVVDVQVSATSLRKILEAISRVESAVSDASVWKCDMPCQIHAKWLVVGDERVKLLPHLEAENTRRRGARTTH